jgi:hypothetical protein
VCSFASGGCCKDGSLKVRLDLSEQAGGGEGWMFWGSQNGSRQDNISFLGITKAACLGSESLEKQATNPMGRLCQIPFFSVCAVVLAMPRRLIRISRTRRVRGVGTSWSAGNNSRFFVGEWIGDAAMLKEGSLPLSIRRDPLSREKVFYPRSVTCVIGPYLGTSGRTLARTRARLPQHLRKSFPKISPELGSGHHLCGKICE